MPYSGYAVQGQISPKHQFLFPVVISANAISAKQSYTESRDCIKIVMYGVEFCTIDSMIRSRIKGYHVYKDTWNLAWY